MLETVFREYDIRGKVGSEMPLDQVYDLARAIATYYLEQDPNIKTVSLGADGRIHSPQMKKEIVRALQDAGLDVVYIGMCPTPVLYFSLFTLPMDAGLMITASHNGKEYNGIKISMGRNSVWGDQLQKIKHIFYEKKWRKLESKGRYSEHVLIPEYVQWLKDNFPHLVGMQTRVVVDCGNGAAGTVWPLLIQEMRWPNVELLFAEVDGSYPHHDADPVVEKNMRDVRYALQTQDFEFGLGFDGDCDRMAPMTKSGELVLGDKVLALFSKSILGEHPGTSIVFDIKCSSGLPEIITAWGGKPCMSPTGHSIIKNHMLQHSAMLAGELSCHFFFKDRYFGYDDGNYAALRLFELLQHEQKPLETLLEIFPKKYSTPEIRLAYQDHDVNKILTTMRNYFEANPAATISLLDGIRVILSDSWGLVRASNTQPVICLRFEADTQEGLQKIKDNFKTILVPFFDQNLLMQELG